MLNKVLVIRNDKLGDFMLAYPSFAMLKLTDPTIVIHALVPEYTRDLAEECEWIDEVIIDPGRGSGFKSFLILMFLLKKNKYFASITLFSTTRIGWLLFLVSIPLRIAPATKIAQLFYNKRIKQRRSWSVKPEYEYNLDLVSAYFKCEKVSSLRKGTAPYLSFPLPEIEVFKHEYFSKNKLSDCEKLVMIHPGSGGSATNLLIEQYAMLASSVAHLVNYRVVITCGPGELGIAEQLLAHVREKGESAIVFESTEGLKKFAKFITLADIFISGSTGPLHIAGALNKKTVGFYPRGVVTSSLRWQTMSEPKNRLAFFPDEIYGEDDMACIDMKSVFAQIKHNFISKSL